MTGRLARPGFSGAATALRLPRSLAVNARGQRLGHPGIWLAAVAALIYLNQVLFTVYVLRVRGGDPSFIARYLPAGWFSLARDRGAGPAADGGGRVLLLRDHGLRPSRPHPASGASPSGASPERQRMTERIEFLTRNRDAITDYI